MQILCEQSTQKVAIKRAKRHTKMEKTSTIFENKSVHDKVTVFTSSKLWSLFKSSANFKCVRILENTWKVCGPTVSLNVASNQHIPKFNRVHTVTFVDGHLHCIFPWTKV